MLFLVNTYIIDFKKRYRYNMNIKNVFFKKADDELVASEKVTIGLAGGCLVITSLIMLIFFIKAIFFPMSAITDFGAYGQCRICEYGENPIVFF